MWVGATRARFYSLSLFFIVSSYLLGFQVPAHRWSADKAMIRRSVEKRGVMWMENRNGQGRRLHLLLVCWENIYIYNLQFENTRGRWEEWRLQVGLQCEATYKDALAALGQCITQLVQVARIDEKTMHVQSNLSLSRPSHRPPFSQRQLRWSALL